MNKERKENFYLKLHEIDIPLYRGKLIIILTNDMDELQEKIPNFSAPEIYGHSIMTNWNGHQGFCVILNFDNQFQNITHGAIAHEALHISSMICQGRGINADFYNDEPQAYLCGWIVDVIYSFLSKENRQPKLDIDDE